MAPAKAKQALYGANLSFSRKMLLNIKYITIVQMVYFASLGKIFYSLCRRPTVLLVMFITHLRFSAKVNCVSHTTPRCF